MYKHSLIVILILSLSACNGQSKAPQISPKNEKVIAAENGFALVELFTSQGCSSCPPADKNLSEIVKGADDNNLKIYALSFHVDYWNRLGWKDPFSKPEYTQRQSMYASALKLSSIYTPQMVTNGEYEFVGSNKDKSEMNIKTVLEKKSSHNLFLAAPSSTDGKFEGINYSVEGNVNNLNICTALVESGKTTMVKNGENAGKKLINDHVVVWFHEQKAEQTGTIDLSDSTIHLSTASEFIIFLQNNLTKKIVSASKIKL
jgi:hypothetical protein